MLMCCTLSQRGRVCHGVGPGGVLSQRNAACISIAFPLVTLNHTTSCLWLQKDTLVQRAKQISKSRNYPFDLSSIFTRPPVEGKDPIEQVLAITDAGVMLRDDKYTPEQGEPAYTA